MNKRGISAIVATVLVILITVAGVAIIWVGVLPMISESFMFRDLDGRVSVLVAGGHTVYDVSREVATVQVLGSDVCHEIAIISAPHSGVVVGCDSCGFSMCGPPSLGSLS